MIHSTYLPIFISHQFLYSLFDLPSSSTGSDSSVVAECFIDIDRNTGLGGDAGHGIRGLSSAGSMFLEVEYSRELLPKGASSLLLYAQLYDHVTYCSVFVPMACVVCYIPAAIFISTLILLASSLLSLLTFECFLF